MTGWNERKTAVKQTVLQVLQDEKLREPVLSGLAAGVAARRRSQRLSGGLASQIAADRRLRQQLDEMVGHFRKAQRRVEKKRSHGVRNFLLFVTGVGMAAAAVPAVRRVQKHHHAESPASDPEEASRREVSSNETTLAEEIEVAVPVSAAYEQWTRFEEFPKFMEGVQEVNRLDDALLHWAVSVAGKHAEWDAKIIEQEPDRRIAWESIDGRRTRGLVTFEPVGPSATSVRLELSYQARDPAEKAGSAAGLDKARVRGDLERFRDLIESKRAPRVEWSGESENGESTNGERTSDG